MISGEGQHIGVERSILSVCSFNSAEFNDYFNDDLVLSSSLDGDLEASPSVATAPIGRGSELYM